MIQTILNLAKRKWNIVNDNSKANYEDENEINFKTEVLKSNLCDYNNSKRCNSKR